MDFEKVVYERRTIRRFEQKDVPLKILEKLVDFARIAPSGMNVQGLEYVIVKNEIVRKDIFPNLRWAGALPKNLRTPEEGRRPTAYIIVLIDTKIKKKAPHDVGASVQNILLGATNYGLGACWMGAIDRKAIKKSLDLPKKFDVSHVISLGYPDEESTMENYKDSFKYWKDEKGKMHVPKRALEDVLQKVI